MIFATEGSINLIPTMYIFSFYVPDKVLFGLLTPSNNPHLSHGTLPIPPRLCLEYQPLRVHNCYTLVGYNIANLPSASVSYLCLLVNFSLLSASSSPQNNDITVLTFPPCLATFPLNAFAEITQKGL